MHYKMDNIKIITEDLRIMGREEIKESYWRNILRERKDPNIAFFDMSPVFLNILKRVAKKEGATKIYKPKSGYLKGKIVVKFNGLYNHAL